MITKNMKLGDVVRKYPETVEVFLEFGLHCVGCHIAGFESIEEGARAHGMSNEKIEELLEKLNKKVKKEGKKCGKLR